MTEPKASFSVGDATIDAQHRELFRIIDEVLKEVEDTEPRKKILETLTFLGDYITCHLAHEEKYMQAHAFPGLEEHLKEHEALQISYGKFRNEFENKEVNQELYLEIRVFIRNWWYKHILVEDHKYYAFIRDNEDSHPSDEAKDYHDIDSKIC